jgi:hypothetical protein
MTSRHIIQKHSISAHVSHIPFRSCPCYILFQTPTPNHNAVPFHPIPKHQNPNQANHNKAITATIPKSTTNPVLLPATEAPAV